MILYRQRQDEWESFPPFPRHHHQTHDGFMRSWLLLAETGSFTRFFVPAPRIWSSPLSMLQMRALGDRLLDSQQKSLTEEEFVPEMKRTALILTCAESVLQPIMFLIGFSGETKGVLAVIP